MKGITIGGLCTAGILILTNPSKDLYADRIASEIIARSPVTLCAWLENSRTEENAVFLNPLLMVCKQGGGYGISFLRGDIKTFVEKQTTHQNLVFCSLYTTQIPGMTIKAVGVLNMFVPYSVEGSLG
jgi:hypothetical protein